MTLDSEAARLLGLPAAPAELTEAAVCSRFHPVDFAEINGIVQLALTEKTLAEARLRIVDARGRAQRIVRSRSRPRVVDWSRLELLAGSGVWTRAGTASRRGSSSTKSTWFELYEDAGDAAGPVSSESGPAA